MTQQSKGVTTTASTSEERPVSASIQQEQDREESQAAHTKMPCYDRHDSTQAAGLVFEPHLSFPVWDFSFVSDTAFSSLTESSLESRAKK